MTRLLLLTLALALPPGSGPLSEADLAPVLSGAGAGAGALLEGGKPTEALAALGGATRAEARWVRGLALQASGAPDEALAALDGLEARLPDLSDRIQLARGQALAALQRWLEASVAFGAVAPGSPRFGEAAMGRAHALVAAGDRAAALLALAPMFDQPPPADPARPDLAAQALLLAGTLQAGSVPPAAAEARASFLACWAGHPMAAEGSACLAGLSALPGEDARPPGEEETLRRAEGLVERNKVADAVALLEPLAKRAAPAGPDQPLACRERAALGRALRRDRKNGRAEELLRPVVERCSDPAVRTRAAYVLATAVSAQGRAGEAIGLYLRFAEEHGDSSLADDALLAAADLLATDGRIESARQTLQALLRDHPRGDKFDEARFRLAWLARRDGDEEAAIAALEVIEADRREVDPYEHARASYWRARLLEARGPEGRAAAEATWRRMVEEAPADFYSLLARGRLEGVAMVALPRPLATPRVALPRLDPGPLGEDPRFRAGLVLLRCGLPRAATEELLAVDRGRLAGTAGAPSPPVLLLAAALTRAGDHRDAHQLLRTEARAVLRGPPVDAARPVWELAYPQAWAPLVKRYSTEAGVPPELLQALMREESALDPEAVSAVGAVGLTQLMLPTAQQVAGKLKLPRPDRAALAQPETSIQLGAAYLGQLLRRYDGSPAPALAAYNAGENVVGRWRSGGRDAELDVWIEEIPYDETRGYVKRVLRSYASYRLLGPPPQAAQAGAPARPGG